MKAREMKPLYDELLRSMPGFAAHKRLLLMTPMHGMLRAVHFDPSAFDKASITPSTLVMTLCVPTDHLSLLFGHRLRHPDGHFNWSFTRPNVARDLSIAIKEQALPYLARAGRLQGFVDLASEFMGNPHTPKEIAFALARVGETTQAVKKIDALLPTLNLSVAWQQDIREICTHLRNLLMSDPDAAHRQLEEWERFSIEKLKLDAFR